MTKNHHSNDEVTLLTLMRTPPSIASPAHGYKQGTYNPFIKHYSPKSSIWHTQKYFKGNKGDIALEHSLSSAMSVGSLTDHEDDSLDYDFMMEDKLAQLDIHVKKI